ncbi:hypothetical protein HDV04_000033 [Boothiomyces sp. JEL0838]|nr:hypothetical protein HDV04_000033 [Boothiomyces sp. JEL0838]
MSQLPPDTVEKLRQEKIRLRVENELYLRNHPEIKFIIQYFMRHVLIERPQNVEKIVGNGGIRGVGVQHVWLGQTG